MLTSSGRPEVGYGEAWGRPEGREGLHSVRGRVGRWFPRRRAGSGRVGPHGVQVTFPFQFPAELLDVFLLSQAQLQQCRKTEFDDVSLGLQVGGTQGVLHQLLVDLDVGSHDVDPL